MLTKIKCIILTLLNSFNDIYTLQFSTLKMTKSNKHNKFISLYPAGINGFYTLGIASYIFDNYQTQEYNYIGASSGSWNSLICCYKHNKTNFIKGLIDQPFFEKPKDIYAIQYGMFRYIFENYHTRDFDLDKLHICLSELKVKRLELVSLIISDFTSLGEALSCCMSSSHIPYITSNQLINEYQGRIVFDGGFSSFPPETINVYFSISSTTFNYSDINSALCGILSRNVSSKVIKDLYHQGYVDGKNNKKYLDEYFNPSQENKN